MPRPATFVFPNPPPVLGDPDFAADAQGYLGAFPDLLTYVEEMADFLQTDFATELANGSAALPSMAFASDLNTGFYREAVDQIGASTGGVRRWLLSNTAFQVDVPITGTAVVANSTDVTAGRLLTTAAGPAQAFRRGNIVGTVSQAAGVPTGAVIESGSNANGRYTRWADGTQICVKSITGQGPINIAFGSGFRSDAITIGAWAAVFSEVPVRMLSTSEATNLSCSIEGSGPGSASNGGFALLTRYVTTSSTAFVVDAMAVGRWF